MYRRDRNRRYRDDDYIVEEVYIEEDPYYYEEERTNWWVSLLGILFVIGILVVLASFIFKAGVRRTHRRAPVAYQQQTGKSNAPEFQSVPIGTPLIDLKAVEDALWQTKTSNPKDFTGWMKKFEDEVNAIYFATLRRQNPKADPATLMKQPIRVEPKRVNNLLTIYGYSDDNKKQGYQNGEDKLVFVFQQTKPYQQGAKQLHYSLRDGSGYYYRQPTYAHTYASMMVTPMLLGFFLYPTIWYGMWYRPMFGWWGPGFYSRGIFYSRYNYYYRSYPSYRRVYQRTYYSRHRPWGWNRGSYYRRGSNGRYTSRTSRYSGSRYRSRGTRSGSRYRSRGTRSGSRYRSRGSQSGSRYRSRGTRSGSRYRSRGSQSGSRYRSRRRSSGSRYRSRRRFGGYGRRRR